METQNLNGVIYQRSGPGEPWKRVGGGRMIPKSETTVRKEGADADRAAAEAQKAIAEANTAADRARAELIRAQADAAKATADATKTSVETASLPTPQTPEVRRARNELATDSVIEKIGNARRQIGEGWATGNVAGTGAFQAIPFAGQNSADLAATLEGVTGSLINDTLKDFRAQSATGASGFGSLTEREAQRLSAAVASMRQTQSKESLLANLATVEKHYRNLMALKNNEDPTDPAVAERYGIVVSAPVKPAAPSGGVGMGGPGEMGALPQIPAPNGPAPAELTPEGRMVADPALSGANATVTQMIREGRSEGEIRAYLNRLRPGMGDQANAIGENIRYYNQNPNFTPQVDVEQVWQPASGFNQFMGNAAQWEVPGIGFSPGAAVIGAGDMFSFGTLDNFADNPDMARAVMEGVEQQSPGSFLTGQIAGGIASGIGAEAALGRAGLGAVGRMRGGDFALGAGYGAGSSDHPYESRLSGAGAGGLFGLGGGMAGRGVARTVGRAAQGVTDPARRALAEADVPMTIGQLLGGVVQRTEDRVAGLPFVGDLIARRRMEGVEGFNRAAFDEGLSPIAATTGGVVGEQGIDMAQSRVGDAYTAALGGSQVQVDQQFGDDLVAAIESLRAVPRVGSEATDTVKGILRPPETGGNAPSYFGADDTLTGTNMQPMVRELRKLSAAYAPDPLGGRIAQGVGQVENAVTGMFDRQAPEVMPAYLRANEAFRNEEVLRGAVHASRNGARSTEPGLFMPSQLLDSAAANAGKYGNGRGTTRQPFFDLARAGQRVLPSKLPDSGTAGRIALPTVFAAGGYAGSDEGEGAQGAGAGLATGATIAALLSAPYARGSRDGIARAMLAERNPAIQRIGQEISDLDRIAGLLTAAPLLAWQGQ